MPTQVQGVDLSTGKLSLPIQLVSLYGPNNFGEDLSIQYSTLGLLPTIKTWNKEPLTGILGLGWSLSIPSIIRLGNGSIRDQFLLNGALLLLKTNLQNSPLPNYLEFETAQYSLNQIKYFWKQEYWEITDPNGVVYIYGQIENATEYRVRWVNEKNSGSGIAVWSGTSIDTQKQQNYAVKWNLAYKKNIYGQQINYTYDKVKQNVGENNNGLNYDVATYLSKIQVVNGDSIQFYYREKNGWEYPALRIKFDATNTKKTNAYQDHIQTRFLDYISLFDSYGNLQHNINLEYGFLWDTYTNVQNKDLINKRLLLSISISLPNGYPKEPKQEFNYWGYNQGDGFNNFYNQSNFDALKLTNADLDGSNFKNFKPYTDAQGNTYYQLFGHLKYIKTATGSSTWYCYREVAKNFDETFSYGKFSDLSSTRLDLKNIVYPDGQELINSIWERPQPYWGPDGYVVLTFYRKDGTQIHIDIYEWLGQWIKVKIERLPETINIHQSDTDKRESYNLIEVGAGLVAIVRTDISDPQGAVILLNRDPYLPGQWEATMDVKNIIINRGKEAKYIVDYRTIDITKVDSNTIISTSIDDNLVTILDKVTGTLYAYGWNGISWDRYVSNPFGTNVSDYTLASRVIGRASFGIAIPTTNWAGITYTVQYYLLTYDPTPLNGYIFNKGTLNLLFSEINTDTLVRAIHKINIAISNGFIVINPEIMNISVKYIANEDGSSTKTWGIDSIVYKPLIVSWDSSDFTIFYEQLLLNTKWNWLQDKSTQFPWQGDGTITELADNIYYTGSGLKIALRYTGSNQQDKNGNIGWITKEFKNSTGNDDYFGSLPLIDSTIEADGTARINYMFYQFNPNTKTWETITNLSESFSTRTDWKEIVAIVTFSLNIAGLILGFLGPLAEGAAIIGTAGRLLEFTTPITAITSRVVGTLATSLFTSESAILVTNLATSTLLGQAEGMLQNYTIEQLLARANSGYQASYGNYVIFGHQSGDLSCFYRVWDTNSATWQWSEIANFDPRTIEPNSPKELAFYFTKQTPKELPTGPHTGVSSDSFIVGDGFIAYDYTTSKSTSIAYSQFLSTGQVAFLRNGRVSKLVRMPVTNKPTNYNFNIYDGLGSNNPLSYVAYQLGSACKEPDPYTGTSYTSPVLASPWGGILGFLGQLDEKTFGDNFQWYFAKALSFGLFMAKDEALEGSVVDYVINKITTYDGFQSYNTHFQYMPEKNAFDPGINTIRYNKVCIAQGGNDYKTSALVNGWTETYFYNGGLHYKTSPYTNDGLPFDPAAPNNAFDELYQDKTNEEFYFRLMTGKIYCERSLRSQNNTTDIQNGYETSRQQIFYRGFTRALMNNTHQVSSQKTQGVLPILQVNYIAAVDATYSDIFKAYTNSKATLNYTYNLYDLNGNYGPISPNISLTDPANNFASGLSTGLPLGSITFDSVYQDDGQNKKTVVSATYIQNLPGFMAKDQSGNLAYNDFLALGLYTPYVQKTTWVNYNLDFSFVPDASSNSLPTNFPMPSKAWGMAGWQVVSSEVNSWQKFDQRLWHPAANHQWRGNLSGTPQTTSLIFPWSNPPYNNQITEWFRTQSVDKLTNSGIVLTTTNPTGSPSTIIYDNNQRIPVASFVNAGKTGGLAFYAGFESYEDLSSWSLTASKTDGSTIQIPVVFSTISDTGNRSLQITTQDSNINWYMLTYTLKTPINYPNPAQDWFFLIRAGSNESLSSNFTYQIFDNTLPGPAIIQPGLNSGTTLPYNGNGVTWITDIMFIRLQGNTSNTIQSFSILIKPNQLGFTRFIDNVYFVPMLQSEFKIVTYDSKYWLPISSASFNDLEFSTRSVYNSRQNLIGIVRKSTNQPYVLNTAQLLVNYFSREGNQDNLDAKDPNSSMLLNAGVNSTTAGYYFDFRDQKNPWSVGTVKDRGLYLEGGQQTNYPLPTDYIFGIGIRVQIQPAQGTSSSLTIPSTVIGIEDYLVKWDTNEKSYTINGPSISTQIRYIPQNMGDWLFFIIKGALYLYVDGQQIFALPLNDSNLAHGNFTIKALEQKIVCRDIIIIKDFDLTADYYDGSGKIRQKQKLSDINLS